MYLLYLTKNKSIVDYKLKLLNLNNFFIPFHLLELCNFVGIFKRLLIIFNRSINCKNMD